MDSKGPNKFHLRVTVKVEGGGARDVVETSEELEISKKTRKENDATKPVEPKTEVKTDTIRKVKTSTTLLKNESQSNKASAAIKNNTTGSEKPTFSKNRNFGESSQKHDQASRRFGHNSKNFGDTHKGILVIPDPPNWELRKRYQVCVSHFKSPSHFYLRQLADIDFWRQIENKMKNEPKLKEIPEPWVNGVFLIFDNFNRLHRVLINDIITSQKLGTKFNVYFIDQGRNEFLMGATFFTASFQLIELPPACILATLEKELLFMHFDEEFVKIFVQDKSGRLSAEILTDRDEKRIVKIYLDNRPLSECITKANANSGARAKVTNNFAQDRLRNSAKLQFQKNGGAIHPESKKYAQISSNSGSLKNESSIDISKLNLNSPPPILSKDLELKRDTISNLYTQPPPAFASKYQSPTKDTVYQTNIERNDLGAENLYYEVTPPSSVSLKIVSGKNDSNLRRPNQNSSEKPFSSLSKNILISPSRPKEVDKCDSIVNKLKESNKAFKIISKESQVKSASHPKTLQKNILEQTPNLQSKHVKSDSTAGASVKARQNFVPLPEKRGQAKLAPNFNSGKPEISERKNIPNDSFVKIRIGEVSSPSEFYIISEENDQLFRQICSVLDENNDQTLVLNPGSGTRCLALDNRKHWRRVEVLGSGGQTCSIQFLDTGKLIESYFCTKLLQMPTSLEGIPPLAFNVKLLGFDSFEGNAEATKHFKTLLGFEQEEVEEDFYLLAKSLSQKNAESLEEATPIELKDNQDTNIGQLLLHILSTDLEPEPEVPKRFFWETSALKCPSLPQDPKEVLTFQSFTDVLDEVNLFRPKVLVSMEEELYGLEGNLHKESNLEPDLLVLVKKLDQENSESVDLYRSRIVSVGLEENLKIEIDLFDYELKLELTKNLGEENYVCDSLDGSFQIFEFPKQLLKFDCPVLRLKLDGVPAKLKDVNIKLFDESLELLKESLQNEERRNEFRIVDVSDAEQTPPIVRIRSKADNDVNSLIFSTLLSALELESNQVTDDTLIKCSDERRPEVTVDGEAIYSMLRPFYKFLNLGLTYEGIQIPLNEVDKESDYLFWLRTLQDLEIFETMNKDLLSVLEPMLSKSKFKQILQELPIAQGEICLAYADLGQDRMMFWRVLVLFVSEEKITCHFLDMGKQDNLLLDKTIVLPMPGTAKWTKLVSQVPEKFQSNLLALDCVVKRKPLASPCKLDQKSREELTLPFLSCLDKNSALILERSINSSCLGAIYAQDFSNLKKVCPVKFLKSNENFHKIASNVFLFWTSEPQTVQIKCESATNHMAVQQNEKITLESNCAIITKSHIIRSGQDLNVEAKIKQWPANWNVSHLLFDLEPATLAAQIHNLNLISYPATPPRDLQNLINQTQPHTLNTMMIIVLVATFLLFLIIIFLGIRYCKLKNQSSPK